ncbi:MAG: hypothetical protein V2A76_01130 [Planctomycetota bacterium]
MLPFLVASLLLLFLQALLARTSPLAPDLGPLLAVYLGLYARREWVSGGVLVLGILRAAIDLEPVGAILLIHLTIAHAVLFVRGTVFRDRAVTQWVVSFAAGALYVMLHLLFSVVLDGVGAEGSGGLFRVVMSTLVATLVAPGVIGLLRVCRVGP